MGYITSGNAAVDSMGKINISGNVIPQMWYRTVIKDNGKPHLLAVTVLADIVYWYRPSEVRDEGTGQVSGWKKHFKGDMLQKTYQQYSDLFGESKRSIKAAFDRLEGLGVIKRFFRNVTCSNGIVLNNIMFISLDTDVLYRLTYPGDGMGDTGKKQDTTADTGSQVKQDSTCSAGHKDATGSMDGEDKGCTTRVYNNKEEKTDAISVKGDSSIKKGIWEKETTPIQKNVLPPVKDMDIHKDKKCPACNEGTKYKADKTKLYSNIIKQNIDYDNIKYDLKGDYKYLDELLGIIVDTVSFEREKIHIGGADMPYQAVKSRFMKLDSLHIRYVLGCMKNNTKKIMNIKAYLLAALYNAPYTINHYYQSQVNHDLYGVYG